MIEWARISSAPNLFIHMTKVHFQGCVVTAGFAPGLFGDEDVVVVDSGGMSL